MILFVNVTEFDRSEPTKVSDEVLSALTNLMMLISNDIVIAPHKSEFTKERFQIKLLAQDNNGGFPFTIGCSFHPEVQKAFNKLDDYARRSRFLLAFSGDQNWLNRTYYIGRSTGPSIYSRTTSIEMVGECRTGGWTIKVTVRQWTEDKSINLQSLISELKSVLETVTSKQVSLE